MISHKDLIEFAKEQLTNHSETAYRAATSRAYYATLHAVKDFQNQLNIECPGGSSHERVVNACLRHSDKRLKRIGNQLNQAKVTRVKADYRLDTNISIHDAKSVMNIYKKITSSVEGIAGNDLAPTA